MASPPLLEAMPPKAKAKAKVRAMRAAPKRRGALRRPAHGGPVDPAPGDRELWRRGEIAQLNRLGVLGVEELTVGTRVVCPEASYFGTACQVAGRTRGVDVQDTGIHYTLQLTGTTSESLLRHHSGHPDMERRVRRCEEACTGDRTSEDLIHVKKIRKLVREEGEEGWTRNLEKVEPAEDELAALRARGEDLDRPAVPGRSDKGEKREKEKKKEEKPQPGEEVQEEQEGQNEKEASVEEPVSSCRERQDLKGGEGEEGHIDIELEQSFSTAQREEAPGSGNEHPRSPLQWHGTGPLREGSAACDAPRKESSEKEIQGQIIVQLPEQLDRRLSQRPGGDGDSVVRRGEPGSAGCRPVSGGLERTGSGLYEGKLVAGDRRREHEGRVEADCIDVPSSTVGPQGQWAGSARVVDAGSLE